MEDIVDERDSEIMVRLDDYKESIVLMKTDT